MQSNANAVKTVTKPMQIQPTSMHTNATNAAQFKNNQRQKQINVNNILNQCKPMQNRAETTKANASQCKPMQEQQIPNQPNPMHTNAKTAIANASTTKPMQNRKHECKHFQIYGP